MGQVSVEEIDRSGFINSVQDEPDMALKIIGNLSERLRQTNEMVTSPASRKVLADMQQKPSIWTLIGGLIDQFQFSTSTGVDPWCVVGGDLTE